MDLEKIKQSPRFRGNVPSKAMDFLPKKEKGDIIYATDEDMTYMYDGNVWMPIKLTENQVIDTGMSLLELNRDAISKLPCKIAYDFKDKVSNMFNDFKHQAKEYLMLYGQEINYFTVFKMNHSSEECLYDDFWRAFLDCLDNIGKVYSIDYADENKHAIEVWVKTSEGKTTVLYLFPYDDGIVTVKY